MNISLHDLCATPGIRELICPETEARIHSAMKNDAGTGNEPLVIRILLGVGAWFAAFFLLGFLCTSQFLGSSTAMAVWGIMLLGAAALFSRTQPTPFLTQFVLALAFAGNVLIIFATDSQGRSLDIASLLTAHATVCLVAYPLINNVIYRFVAPLLLAVLAGDWIVSEKLYPAIHIMVAVSILLTVMLLVRRQPCALLRPLGYAAAAMLPAFLLFLNTTQAHIWDTRIDEPLGLSSAIIAAGIVYSFMHLAGGMHRLHEPWLLLSIVATVILGAFTTPGVLVAIGLLALGHARGDRCLTALGYSFLPAFLIVFYYALNVDLIHKSWLLAGSGAVLLAIRATVQRLAPKEVSQ